MIAPAIVSPKRDDKRPAPAARAGSAANPMLLELCRRFSLTAAEARVVCLMAEGLSYGEIGERLGVSYHTVHTHMKAIHQKVGVSTNLKLLARIRGLGER